MKRDEPKILADMIRLADRLNAGDAELVDQARATLHRYVVAQGKRDIATGPGDWPFIAAACFVAGLLVGWSAF